MCLYSELLDCEHFLKATWELPMIAVPVSVSRRAIEVCRVFPSNQFQQCSPLHVFRAGIEFKAENHDCACHEKEKSLGAF